MLKIDPDDEEDSEVDMARKAYENDTNALIPSTRSLRGNQVRSLMSQFSMVYSLSASSALTNNVVLVS